MLDRRQFSIGISGLIGSGALFLAACRPDVASLNVVDNDADLDEGGMNSASADAGRFQKVMEGLEQAGSGRLGAALIDTGSGRRFAWRGDERFPLCSTFKFLLAAATLARVDSGAEKLDRKVAVARTDIVSHSPVTEKAVDGTMTVADLCKATITTSDNAAANLLLAPLDGAPGFTRWVRSIGDDVTRLDRPEPMLNESAPGDPRDTTSPAAMAANLEKLLLGKALSPRGRATLGQWLEATTTGAKRIRAGTPADWRVGDKTGTGENGATNDIAILWPPARKPVLLALYLVESKAPHGDNEALLAKAARAALDFIG